MSIDISNIMLEASGPARPPSSLAQNAAVCVAADMPVSHIPPDQLAVGPVTTIPGGHQVARTERGQRGWGVHSADGELISSGWTTRTQALAYTAKLTAQAGA
jgi:hypothetical protein